MTFEQLPLYHSNEIAVAGFFSTVMKYQFDIVIFLEMYFGRGRMTLQWH